METYKLKFTKLQNEIFRLLCIKAGMSLNQRGIARLLNVSPTAVAKALKSLEEEDMIKIEKNKNMNLMSIELNRDNQRAIEFKRIENLKLIYESGIIEELSEIFPGSTIILFGSYSRGEDTEKSDLDIAIIGAKEKKIDLVKYDKMFERTIFINFYDHLKNVDKNLKENLLNGILLYGAVEL